MNYSSEDLFPTIKIHFGDKTDIHYTNLQFSLNPLIKGSYQKYSGQSNTVEQPGNYKANIDDVVSMGDSPHHLFKGVMFKQVGSQYARTERWYAAGDLLNQGITPPIPQEYLHPFGKLQIFAVWNQHNRSFLKLSGSLRGLKLNGDVPDQVYNYYLNAPNTEVDVQDKYFILTNREIDPESGEWSADMIEVFDEDVPKVYDDDYTFKYKQR